LEFGNFADFFFSKKSTEIFLRYAKDPEQDVLMNRFQAEFSSGRKLEEERLQEMQDEVLFGRTMQVTK
jgi:hypothetical protein